MLEDIQKCVEVDKVPVTLSSPSSDVQALPTPMETLKEADALIADEKPGQAQALLNRFLKDRDNPMVWMKLSKVYRLLNDTIAARAILRNVILRVNDPHIMNIIAARIPLSKMIVLENLKVLYVNIPKCGSSSMKDAVLLANQKSLRGETSHFHVREYERIVRFAELDTLYKDYTKAAIIRHPRDRLRSYYSKNIREERSLVRESGGKSSFYDLDTAPTYNMILANFDRYRNVFEDFRHHTDSIVGYLGMEKSRFSHIFDIADTQAAIALLLDPKRGEVPVIHNMRTKNADHESYNIDVELESRIITEHYAIEMEVYL